MDQYERHVEESVPVPLTAEQKIATGDELAGIQNDIENIEAEKADLVADFREKLKAKRAKLSELAGRLLAGVMVIKTACVWKMHNPKNGRKSLFVVATGEKVQEADMTAEDNPKLDEAPEVEE